MHVISETTLDEFVSKRPASERPVAAKVLKAWLTLTKRGHWRTTHDVLATFPQSDFLAGGIVIFDIGGNKYRISANIKYVNATSRVGRIYIRHVMTHAEYDQRCADGTL